MKQIFGVGTRSVLAAVAPAILCFTQPTLMHSQTAAPAKLHGKVNDATGAEIKRGEVRLTTDKSTSEKGKDRKFEFSFPIDATGNYNGTGIAPGDYIAFVYVDGKTPDFLPVQLKTGEDRVLNFDMTRAEYLKDLSPEERTAIEETKKKNASANVENAKIGNINQTLQQARADVKAGKADEAITSLTNLNQQRPNEPVLWAALGEAQSASGDAAIKAARTEKTNPNDPSIIQKYTESAASYQKAIELNAAAKKPSVEIASASYLNMGHSLALSGKLKEAGDAYESAAKANPAGAGTAYYNEAATFLNAGKNDEASVAADKAIAADPKRAEAYYVKGQSLISKATVDPKTQKIVAPPGCVEAYQSYLEYAPDGPHAADVKGILTGIGATVKQSYKAGRK